MKKRALFLSLCLILSLLTFTACSGGGVLNQSGGQSSTGGEATAGDVWANAPTFELSLQGHISGEQLKRTLGGTLDLIAEATRGTVKIQVYDAGVLMPVPEMLNALESGELDMMYCPEGTFASIIPVTQLGSGMPYAFSNNFESLLFMWNEGLIDVLREEYAKHNAIVFPMEAHSEGVLTDKAINGVADLQGYKLRSSGNLSLWENQVGANVTNVAGGEIYTAVAQGVVNGATWGSAAQLYEMKLMEVLDYYMLPEPNIGRFNCLYFNLDIWNGFTDAQRTAIEGALHRGAAAIQINDEVMYYRALNSMQQDYGVEIVQLSLEEQVKMREVGEKVWDEIAAKDAKSAEIVAKLKTYVEESRTKEHVVPTLNALQW
jgi:TRAP-type C4-dicarboxylate transport system substrate-binding protein